ncbi:MAG: PQQ-binding-like beta-propeller repeat protein, partial [Lentisphaeria bacterium]|nr:PQQ-binding-like beta-propeller repeat protein [Lentisphaeria bacterium]
ADLGELPHPNYFADLIVSGRSVAGGQIPLSDTEMLRVLRPEGGIAIIGAPGAMRTTVRGPLDGAGTWTHQYCDPANTNCSPDTLARGPLGALWFTDFGFPMPSRHGRGPAPLYLKGRLFVEGLDALLCVNAYNGRQLWKYPLPGILKAYDQEHIMGASGTGSNFCVTPDAVFVRTGSKCLRIDPATGKLLSELSAPPKPDGKEGVWGYIASVDDTLFGTLSNTEHTVEFRWIRADMSTQFTESMLLFALDPITGKTKWVYTPEASIRNNTIAVGNGRVYLIDRAPAAFDRLDPRSTHVRARRGAKPFPTGKLVALDADTGRRVWTVDKAIYGTLLALSEEHDVLLMSYQDTAFKLISEQGGRMAAFKASTGEQLWDSKLAYKSRPILNGRTLYAQPGAWDLLTGERQDFEFRRYYGCGTLSGSKNLMLFRSGTLGYTDLLRPHGTENYGGVRPGCWINAITGGGIVLMPDASERCRCSYLIKTSLALHPYGIRPPAISPNGGSSAQPIRVKLSSEAGKADIRYTLDGSDPTRSSSEYLGPMPVPKTGTLRARAYSKGAPPSQVAEASFVIDPRIVPIDGTDWRVYETGPDRPQSSVWSLSSGVLTELSNFYRGDAANRDPAMERVGALRIYTPGANFADGELEVDIASSDNDGLGVAFRLSGHDRHYLWAMDQQRGFHILACKNGDSYRLLASKSKGYERNRWYRLRVTLEGARIRVYLDDELDLEATDTTFAKGTFALYAWGCKGAKFRSVRWKSRK